MIAEAGNFQSGTLVDVIARPLQRELGNQNDYQDVSGKLVVTLPECESHASRSPKRRRAVDSLNTGTTMHHHTGADKTDPRYNAGGYLCGLTTGTKAAQSDQSKCRRSDSHERIRFESGVLVSPLAFDTNERTEQGGQHES